MLGQMLAGPFVDFSHAFVLLALNVLVQSTLVILLGLTAAWAFKSKGAALVSAILRTTLIAAILCPVASLCLQGAGMEGLVVSLPEAQARRSGSVDVQPSSAGEVAAVDPPPEHMAAPFAGGHSVADDGVYQPIASSVPFPEEGHGALVAAEVRPAGDEATHRGGDRRALVLLACGLTSTWMLVAAVLLVRIVVAYGRFMLLCKATCHADPEALAECRAAAERMGVRAPSVLRSRRVSSPLLIGWFRPAVLLPEDKALEGTALRKVLVHEMAHLARSDCFWNLLCRVSTAVLFFQPLLWWLARRIVQTAEEVCDDYVVDYGIDRRDYARELVAIAERHQARASLAGVGVVSLKSRLGRRVARILDPSRRLSTSAGRRAVLATILIGLGAAVLVGLVRLGEGRLQAAPNKDDADQAAKSDAALTPDDDLVVIEGRLVDPEGRPFARASVVARDYWADIWEYVPDPVLDEAASDAEGRFRVAFRKSLVNRKNINGDPWRATLILAKVDGFGPAWADAWEALYEGPATLRLVRDDVPIQGRVVDAEGRPIEGVSVVPDAIIKMRGGSAAEWLEAIEKGRVAPWFMYSDGYLPQSATGLPAKLVTDSDGRFRITGVGRDRLLFLRFDEPTIVRETVAVLTRSTEPFVRPLAPSDSPHFNPGQQKFFGATFEYRAAPTQPIEGTVRDAGSGKPLVGMTVQSHMYAGTKFVDEERLAIKTKTGPQGRFRLIGMPRGKGNRLLVRPADDEPYFMTEVDVPEGDGSGPVTVDVNLKQGIMITGRVTDKVTGEPVRAIVNFCPFLSSPYAKQYANFHYGEEIGNVDGFQKRYQSEADGTYRIVGIPGRAILSVKTYPAPYRLGVGAEGIEGLDEKGYFKTYDHSFHSSPNYCNAVREVNLPEDAREAQFDFQLDPGEIVQVRLVDPEDKPLAGVRAEGRTPNISYLEAPLANDRVEIVGLDPDHPRTVLLRHEARNLGLFLHVRVGPDEPGQLTARLLRCATITGRLLFDDGKPVPEARIEAEIEPQFGIGTGELPRAETDEEGRFRYEGVIPHEQYRIRARIWSGGVHKLAEKLAVEPGATIDLGDVTIERRLPTAPPRKDAAGQEPKPDVAAVPLGSDSPGDEPTQTSEPSRRDSSQPKPGGSESSSSPEMARATWFRDRPRTEADHVVAAARARTLGLEKLPRFLIRGTSWHGPVVDMQKLPERSLENLWKVRGKEVDASERLGHEMTVAWEGARLVYWERILADDRGRPSRTYCYYWDGTEGWIGRLSEDPRAISRTRRFRQVFDVSLWTSCPIFRALSNRIAWPGEVLTQTSERVDPSLARYQRVGTETIDGQPCEVFDGPARFERIWIEKSTGRLKAAYYPLLHRSRPEYYTDQVREVVGRTFEGRKAYAAWIERQPDDLRAILSAHWREAHWALTEPVALMVFSDYRQVAPGVEWPMRCERLLLHYVGRTDEEGFNYIRNEIVYDEATTEAPFDPVAAVIAPREGDRIGDSRFDVPVSYEWKEGLTEADIQTLVDEERRK